MKPIQVGLLGIGTVGGGTWEVLNRNADEIQRRAGRAIRITVVADKDVKKARSLVKGMWRTLPVATAAASGAAISGETRPARRNSPSIAAARHASSARCAPLRMVMSPTNSAVTPAPGEGGAARSAKRAGSQPKCDR